MQRLSLSLSLTILLFLAIYSSWPTNQSIQILKKKTEEPIDDFEFYSLLSSIAILVPLGGIFAGLTIGLMSIDETNLNILKRSGSPTQKIYATRIEPLRKNTHLLLVTLLLGNTIINESLPVLFHTIHLDGYQVLVSTALILIFGEIIPQAVCARYGLAVGALFAYPLRIFMALIWVIAFPIAKLLDWILGHQQGVMYRRAELRELVALHGEGHGDVLTKDEVSILRAVLEIRDKTVADVMTRLDDVFMLPVNQKLDKCTLESILQAGHSRIPLYRVSRETVVGVVLVKQLILCDPSAATSLSDFKIRPLPRIKFDMPLFDILHVFEEDIDPSKLSTYSDKSPIWTSRYSPAEPRPYITLGIVTLEDVIEELLGQEIIDETDVYVDVRTKVKVARAFKDLEKKLNTSRMIDKEINEEFGQENTELLIDESPNNLIYQETTHILNNMVSNMKKGSLDSSVLPSPNFPNKFKKKKQASRIELGNDTNHIKIDIEPLVNTNP